MKKPTLKFAYEITAEDKAAFLEMIYAGLKGKEAAEALGSTGTQFRRLKRRGGQHYDEEFAKAWAEAEASEEHRFNREEELRAEVDARSKTSDTILVKRMIAELPEYKVLQHQNFLRHDVNVQLGFVLPGMTREELEEYRTRLVEAKPELKMLPPADAA